MALKALIAKYSGIIAEGRYVLLLNITDKVFSFVIMLLLARTFSTEIFGTIVTLFTLAAVFITIFDLGLPIYLQREVALEESKGSEIFSKIFSVSVLLFVLYFALSFIWLKVFYPEIPIQVFIIIAVMMYVSSLITLCNKALSGLNDFKSQFIAFTLPRVLICVGFIIGIYIIAFSVNALMAIMLTGMIINLIWVFFYLRRASIQFSFKHFSFKNTGSILKISLPLGLAVIFNFLYDKIDILLLSQLKGFTEVAYYNVGYGLFKAGTLAFSFLLVSGFTKVSALKRNKVDVTLFFNEYFKIILIICILVSLLLFFAAEPLIKLLYTDKFGDSVIVLKILAGGLIAVGLNNLSGTVINAMGYFKIVMYITLYALLLNVILNVLFIPQYGLLAPTVITLITEYFILVMEIIYLRKILRA